MGKGLTVALEAVERLGPLIRDEAAEAERTGQLTEAVVEGLRSSGLMGLLVPAELGGLDLTLPESIEVFRAVSEHDASTGWTLAILADGALFARQLGADGLAEVAADGTACIAGSLNPMNATADPAEDGYRLRGTVSYASGCKHADWLMVSAWVVRDGERSFVEGIPELVAGMVPMGQAKILDTWAPTGMRATGSHDCVVEDVLVPDHLMFPWGELAFEPGDDVWSRIPILLQIGMALAAPAVGAARGALDAFVELAGGKVPAASFEVLADKPEAHVAAGQAYGLLLAADATLASSAEDVWHQGEEGREFTVNDRAKLRSRVVTAVSLAADCVDLLHDAAGMNAVKQGAVLERRWRDVHTVTQHFILNPSRHPVVGRVVLGRDPGSPVI
ncbi:MAG TPA: acyl-CoA dehydrogenase family protein [Acidimicrobiales bacterium]|nr:acyl-CoA dehydrogenase family protein [Acidimicrobiales bacterium]